MLEPGRKGNHPAFGERDRRVQGWEVEGAAVLADVHNRSVLVVGRRSRQGDIFVGAFEYAMASSRVRTSAESGSSRLPHRETAGGVALPPSKGTKLTISVPRADSR